MTDPDETRDPVTVAFDEYVTRFRAGDGDPSSILERFEGRDRKELELLIEAFIETGPVSDPDPSDPRVSAIVDRVLEELETPAVGLAPVLATLRQKAKLTQRSVVEAIARSIGASPEETEKIDGYYHRLEWGSLPPDRLSQDLFGTLTKVLRAKPGQLERAARIVGRPDTMGEIFARADSLELNDDASVKVGDTSLETAVPDHDLESKPDRIDQLFTGG